MDIFIVFIEQVYLHCTSTPSIKEVFFSEESAKEYIQNSRKEDIESKRQRYLLWYEKSSINDYTKHIEEIQNKFKKEYKPEIEYTTYS